MPQPIRTDYHTATEYPKPAEEMTLRDVAEWHKKCVRVLRPYGQPNALEQNLLDKRWIGLVAAVAKREGVPVGFLSQFLGELAESEMRLLEVAQEEAEAATMYGNVEN